MCKTRVHIYVLHLFVKQYSFCSVTTEAIENWSKIIISDKKMLDFNGRDGIHSKFISMYGED